MSKEPKALTEKMQDAWEREQCIHYDTMKQMIPILVEVAQKNFQEQAQSSYHILDDCMTQLRTCCAEKYDGEKLMLTLEAIQRVMALLETKK